MTTITITLSLHIQMLTFLHMNDFDYIKKIE